MMKFNRLPRVASMLCLLALPTYGAFADEVLPANAKPLSVILDAVAQAKPGTITKAEFDHGMWEVKTYDAKTGTKVLVDPLTSEVTSSKATSRSELPSVDAVSLLSIVKKIEAKKVGSITKVDYEKGQWEVKLAIPETGGIE